MSSQRSLRLRLSAGIIFAALFAHVASFALAVSRYPGGTWCDRKTVGHSFWSNYLCDLLHTHALDGQENPGAPFARVAMLSMVAALATFWLAVPGRGRGGAVTRGAGALSVLGMIAVSLLPSDRFGSIHGAAVMLAGSSGFLAMALSVHAVSQLFGQRYLGVLGGVALLVAMVDMALYAKLYFLGGDCLPVLPALERVAVLLLIGFLAGAGATLLGSDRESD